MSERERGREGHEERKKKETGTKREIFSGEFSVSLNSHTKLDLVNVAQATTGAWGWGRVGGVTKRHMQ